VPTIIPRPGQSSEDEENEESSEEEHGGEGTAPGVSSSPVNTVLNILSAFVCYGS
jgi:hypothetical protein